MEKLTIAQVGGALSEAEEFQDDEDIYGPPLEQDTELSDNSMQFEDTEDAFSMNTAPTNLDDQYNYSSDPDGGEPG